MRRWFRLGWLCSLACGLAGSAASAWAAPPAPRQLHWQLTCSPEACASPDWGKLRTEWQEHMAEAAAAHGWRLVTHTAPPKGSETGAWVVVNVRDFRFVSPGARYTMGVLVGKASLDAQATFYELPHRKVRQSTRYDTSSNAWQGIFAAMTTKQVAAISDAIVQQAAR